MTVNTFLVGPWIAWDGTISIRVLAYGKRRIHLSSVDLICVIPSYILLHHGVSSHSEEHYAGNALFDYRRIAHPSLHSLLSSRLYDKHKHSDGAHNLQRRKHHSSKRWQIKRKRKWWLSLTLEQHARYENMDFLVLWECLCRLKPNDSAELPVHVVTTRN